MQIGVISDTHGLMRETALQALANSDLIVHAGDIGKPRVIEALREVAPVVAVRGNVDRGGWADDFPQTDVFEAQGLYFYVLHNIADLDIDPRDGFAAVVYGHSHKPASDRRDGVLYFNPGSAGPRRFTLPIALGRIELSEGSMYPEILELDE